MDDYIAERLTKSTVTPELAREDAMAITNPLHFSSTARFQAPSVDTNPTYSQPLAQPIQPPNPVDAAKPVYPNVHPNPSDPSVKVNPTIKPQQKPAQPHR